VVGGRKGTEMKIIDKILNKRTTFAAGSCLVMDIPAAAPVMSAPQSFVAPRSLDFRDMCVMTSDQGRTPHCTGFATAGYIELQNWRTNHHPEQIDGSTIYYVAKKTDGFNGDGTWIKNAAQAALDMKLISGSYQFVPNNRDQLKFAIHSKSACIASFVITEEWNRVASDGSIPDWGSKPATIGGHAVLICGYNDKGVFIQNSWGQSWGLYGFCLLSWPQFDRQFQNGIIFT
jgi:hypothetical protein